MYGIFKLHIYSINIVFGICLRGIISFEEYKHTAHYCYYFSLFLIMLF
nr:MAG TPA: hypothetical protein [Caudoviricetes sp.]